MRRASLLAMTVFVALLLGALPAAADGTCPPHFDPGGNGWCMDTLAFRAWQVDDGIELKWVVVGATGDVSIERQVAGGTAGAVEVATSEAAGEYTMVDRGVQAGPVYLYQVLVAGEVVGDPIEAGVAVSRLPDNDDSYHLYIPMALGLR